MKNIAKKVTTIIIVISIMCIVFLCIKAVKVYNNAKHVDKETLNNLVKTQDSKNSIEEKEEIQVNQDNETVNNSSYIDRTYNNSLETVFINTCNSSYDTFCKNIITLCNDYEYQLTLDGKNNYTITSKSISDKTLKIHFDSELETVSSAIINYNNLLNLKYNYTTDGGEYIFENTEQGGIKYFSSKLEATDFFLNNIESHKYDPYAIIIDDTSNGYSWVNTVTAETDTTQFTGDEDINGIIVPNYFDNEYYKTTNPDVVAVLGDDPRLLYRHYIMHGRAEGRQCSANNGAIIAQNYVYVTSLGKHYHKNNCKYIEFDEKEITLDYAKNFGYKACPVCNP